MSTHEREITHQIQLTTADGLHLSPDARGWSRTPLHVCTLGEFGGRNKRWDYWAVLAGDLSLSMTLADLDTFTLGDVWWANFATGETGGSGTLGGPHSLYLPDRPGTARVAMADDAMSLVLDETSSATRLLAHWYENDRRCELDVTIEKPSGLESLNVVVPWSDDIFNFTSKQWCRPARGSLTCGGGSFDIGAFEPAWGVLDVGRGRWPAALAWNWGGGSGICANHVVGLQFGAKWTEGSGATENGFIIDGRLTKIGRELRWDYDWDNPTEAWHVWDEEGQLDVTLAPRFDKHTSVDVSPDLGSEVHQVFGTWSGVICDDAGVRYEIAGVQGFAEEARQRW